MRPRKFNIIGPALAQVLPGGALPTVAIPSPSSTSSSQSSNFCLLLQESQQESCCDGHGSAEHQFFSMETSNTHKHFFYSGTSRTIGGEPSRSGDRKDTITLGELIHRSDEASLPITDQLKIALKMATGVLQYHSTPWLAEDWSLLDVSFFGVCDLPFEEQGALNTLHFSMGASDAIPDQISAAATTGLGLSTAAATIFTPEQQTLFGVKNMTLSSLGLALLELGYRQPLQAHRKQQEPHDVITARRLADSRPTPLGRKYQNIIKKCFKYDEGLQNPEVQSRVHQDIVCELERMITVLSIEP